MRKRITFHPPVSYWPIRLPWMLDMDRYGREAVVLGYPALGLVFIAYRDHTEPCCERQGVPGGGCCSDCLGTGHTHETLD